MVVSHLSTNLPGPYLGTEIWQALGVLRVAFQSERSEILNWEVTFNVLSELEWTPKTGTVS